MPKIASVQLIDNSEKVLASMRQQAVLGLKAIGQKAEGYAKKDCPVDTGRLHNSISNQVVESEMAVYIGTNVEYAPYVEFNEKARHDPPEFGGGKAHFLRDAAADHGDQYKAIMEAALKA